MERSYLFNRSQWWNQNGGKIYFKYCLMMIILVLDKSNILILRILTPFNSTRYTGFPLQDKYLLKIKFSFFLNSSRLLDVLLLYLFTPDCLKRYLTIREPSSSSLRTLIFFVLLFLSIFHPNFKGYVELQMEWLIRYTWPHNNSR